MADALISPAVGGAMWAASAGALAWSARRVRVQERQAGLATGREDRVALMGVLGAFVFAAQMINFSIPGTGSSGHLAGGLLLAILLGPEAAFLTITSVLIVQALFFADGGLLALGCNIFNMGFCGCFIGYPLAYRPIAGGRPTRARILWGSLAASLLGLTLGASAVVAETTLSGISALPLATFALLMLPIHLAIGVVEGLATAAVVGFIGQARPELLMPAARVDEARVGNRRLGRVAATLAVIAALTAGVLSWFASRNPDGLEWAIARVTGRTELAQPADGAHAALARWQATVAPLPDYDFKRAQSAANETAPADAAPRVVQAGTSVAGLLGAALTLGLAGAVGLALRRRPAAR